MQALLTAVIVLACSAYAAWTLMPAAWRRTLQLKLLRRAPAVDAGGCGGCGGGCAPPPMTPGAPPKAVPITVHRRPPAA